MSKLNKVGRIDRSDERIFDPLEFPAPLVGEVGDGGEAAGVGVVFVLGVGGVVGDAGVVGDGVVGVEGATIFDPLEMGSEEPGIELAGGSVVGVVAGGGVVGISGGFAASVASFASCTASK